MKKHNHKNGHECECCRDGMEAVRKKEQAMIEKHGWYVHFVPGDTKVPFEMNIHTHGLFENLEHTDLQICMSMDPEVAHSVLVNVIEDNIKKGKTFEAGKKYEHTIHV